MTNLKPDYHNLLRIRGSRFTTKKKLDKVIRLKKGIRNVQKKSEVEKPVSPDDEIVHVKSLLEGRRIVELGVLAEKMVCGVCTSSLALAGVQKESRTGLFSNCT